ncbi:MAG: transcription elongation factor subunit Spt4 [Candidatus Odinarchaeia archaeon]
MHTLREKACRICHRITSEQFCPKCKTSSLSYEFTGIVIINDPENSKIAERLNITEKGKYALKVR